MALNNVMLDTVACGSMNMRGTFICNKDLNAIRIKE
jgi:hypothetical protein